MVIDRALNAGVFGFHIRSIQPTIYSLNFGLGGFCLSFAGECGVMNEF
jgi:hypothetical protein